jgi:hypothetical protein
MATLSEMDATPPQHALQATEFANQFEAPRIRYPLLKLNCRDAWAANAVKSHCGAEALRHSNRQTSNLQSLSICLATKKGHGPRPPLAQPIFLPSSSSILNPAVRSLQRTLGARFAPCLLLVILGRALGHSYKFFGLGEGSNSVVRPAKR